PIHPIYNSLTLSFFIALALQPNTTLFPYTTLFRSYLDNSLTSGIFTEKEADLLLTFLAHVAFATEIDSLSRKSQAPRQPEKKPVDRKSTRLNSSHVKISYAVFCLKKKK